MNIKRYDNFGTNAGGPFQLLAKGCEHSVTGSEHWLLNVSKLVECKI